MPPRKKKLGDIDLEKIEAMTESEYKKFAGEMIFIQSYMLFKSAKLTDGFKYNGVINGESFELSFNKV